MIYPDLLDILHWWSIFVLFGIIFLPLTSYFFSDFKDNGYIFSKIIGIILISYLIFLFGFLKILKFEQLTIFLLLFFVLIADFAFIRKHGKIFIQTIKNNFKIFFFEEILFFASLFLWSSIRAYQPEIHGLEKFMDFGFINSILRSEYFPPKDMWFTPFSINYYYYGHLTTAVLTKLSGIPSSITYNLMIATIFAFSISASFSIGLNLFSQISNKLNIKKIIPPTIISGILAAFLVSLAGNLHTIYTLFLPYQNEYPKPIWQLAFSPTTFPNNYWYPNATRFIYNTIHEFPIYSFIVSDLHGHVLGIPIVLTIIAFLLNAFIHGQITTKKIIFLSFLIAASYMTNAWDGAIYLLLTIGVFLALRLNIISNILHHNKEKKSEKNFHNLILNILIVLIGFFIFSFPFSIGFKPFASGIGVLCAPDFLTKIGKIGPFLFEVDHCQRSPFWQLILLYGFFYFLIVSFFIFLKKEKRIYTSDLFAILLILLSTILIIIPEFIYMKDIYPAHYRANTMFKLVYQSFIMLSIVSGYIIVRIIPALKNYILNPTAREKTLVLLYFFVFIFLFLLVSIYPYFTISSYYGDLKNYNGLDGNSYLNSLYPTDYKAILWLNKNIKGQPVILEAQGDSYTDYARVSANTGLPTVLGWTVHEWLWRGTYDIPAPRIPEIQTLYETKDIFLTKQLIKKYNIKIIFIGDLERQKYINLDEEKFQNLGKAIYKNGKTFIYQIDN